MGKYPGQTIGIILHHPSHNSGISLTQLPFKVSLMFLASKFPVAATDSSAILHVRVLVRVLTMVKEIQVELHKTDFC